MVWSAWWHHYRNEPFNILDTETFNICNAHVSTSNSSGNSRSNNSIGIIGAQYEQKQKHRITGIITIIMADHGDDVRLKVNERKKKENDDNATTLHFSNTQTLQVEDNEPLMKVLPLVDLFNESFLNRCVCVNKRIATIRAVTEHCHFYSFNTLDLQSIFIYFINKGKRGLMFAWVFTVFITSLYRPHTYT